METKQTAKKTTAKKVTEKKKEPVVKKAKVIKAKLVTEEQIREKAQEIFNTRIIKGMHGDADSDWLQAEKELLG